MERTVQNRISGLTLKNITSVFAGQGTGLMDGWTNKAATISFSLLSSFST